MKNEFEIGDLVEKVNGYKWTGNIVSVFHTNAGYLRYVVDCTIEGVEGALHIYNQSQLKLKDK